jgi:hypothetical protein
MQWVVIAKLKPAEGTVVEGKSEQAQQGSEGVHAHRVDLIPLAELAEFKVVAFGAVSIPLEKGKERAIVIAVGAAVRTMKCGAAEDALEDPPAFARIHLPASHTTGIYSSEEQS